MDKKTRLATAFNLDFPEQIFSYMQQHPGEYFDYFTFHFFPIFAFKYTAYGPLRTKSGVIFIHRDSNAVIIDPATGEVTDLRPEILRTHEDGCAEALRVIGVRSADHGRVVNRCRSSDPAYRRRRVR